MGFQLRSSRCYLLDEGSKLKILEITLQHTSSPNQSKHLTAYHNRAMQGCTRLGCAELAVHKINPDELGLDGVLESLHGGLDLVTSLADR